MDWGFTEKSIHVLRYPPSTCLCRLTHSISILLFKGIMGRAVKLAYQYNDKMTAVYACSRPEFLSLRATREQEAFKWFAKSEDSQPRSHKPFGKATCIIPAFSSPAMSLVAQSPAVMTMF